MGTYAVYHQQIYPVYIYIYNPYLVHVGIGQDETWIIVIYASFDIYHT